MPARPFFRGLALGASIACAATAQAQSTAPTVSTLAPVEVIGTSPLPGTEVPRDQVPSNVQRTDGLRLRRLQSLDLPDYMSMQVNSVSVNDTQGNPFQREVSYRGFTASPLLGAPQGLSVYLDGVRVNEAFGDVVNWDLIPTNALESVTVFPGSNPLFGLNTLGGALSLRTRSGDTSPGGEISFQAGSFGRLVGEANYGRRLGDHGHLFVALTGFGEDGWRDDSPSRVRQLFVKVGERAADSSWNLSLLNGDTNLVGNGLLPESMLAENRRQIYTSPDRTDNLVTMLTLNVSRRLGGGFDFSADIYTRQLRASTVNGDVNDDFSPPQNLDSGIEHRTQTRSRSSGLAAQLSKAIGDHRVLLGLAYDHADNQFEQSEESGTLDATRNVQVTGNSRVDALISGSSRSASAYASDVVGLAPQLQLTLSGRYNHTRVKTVDDGRAALGLDTSLDGRSTYSRFNPAAGLTWQVVPTLTAFGGFSQGNRTPSPIELGCSDPAHACVLPNALQGDPPLKQVVARTLEAGLRGRPEASLRWSVAAYRTVSQDDLLFISNGHASGYFANVGKTLRQGVELALSQETTFYDWNLSLSDLRATFESAACLLSSSNSSAGTSVRCPGDGEIEVMPGNRLPNLPERSLKFSVQARPNSNWRIGAQVAAFSSQTVRGNENGAQRSDGIAFFGSGKVGGYAVLDLSASVELGSRWQLFAKVANLLDRNYANGGQLGQDAFDERGTLRAPANWQSEQFVAPGAPRGFWIGIRRSFGGRDK